MCSGIFSVGGSSWPESIYRERGENELSTIIPLVKFQLAPYHGRVLKGVRGGKTISMKALELYDQLREASEGKKYLVLSRVFQLVFNRKLKSKEWGFLRKLQNIYGADVVFWSLISSFHIDSSGNPLKYVAAVCKGNVKQALEEKEFIGTDFDGLLEYMEDYEKPDWEKILDAPGKTAQAEVRESDN